MNPNSQEQGSCLPPCFVPSTQDSAYHGGSKICLYWVFTQCLLASRKMASRSSAHERHGRKEGKDGERLHLAMGSSTFLYSRTMHHAPSSVVPAPTTRGLPPGSCRALIISLLFLYASPRGGSFLQILISWLPHFSMFILPVL